MTRSLLLCLPLLLTAACASADRDVAVPQPVPSSSGPAGSEPAAAFNVAPDGTGDAGAGGAALKRCLSLPGVEWKQPYTAAPAIYRVTMGGAPITAFDDCMEDVQGYAAVPMSDAHASFVDQCAGDRREYVVPSYIGMSEDEAMRADPPAAPPKVSSTRVTARDGDCLPVTADFRTDRVDLIVQDGQVIWAGLPDPTGTGTATGGAIDADAPATTFRVSSDGTASPDAYTAAVEKCLALPGVTGSSVQESNPATYEMKASAAAAGTLSGCLADAPGALVKTVRTYQTFNITYRGAYDSARDEALIERCFALPGTSTPNVRRSLPPQYTVTVTGGEAEIAGFRDCARALDNTVVEDLPPTDGKTY